MKLLAGIVLLGFVGVSLLEASSLESFRTSFNKLGTDIDERVQVLRAENSDAILEMNRKMLRLLGNYTLELRDRINATNTTIQVDEWLNENPEAQECFDVAYLMVDLYTYFTSFEIEWCTIDAEVEISADSQYHFYSHAHYIMRAGTDGRGRVLESFGLHNVLDEQLEFLESEQEWLQYLWNNYRSVLEEEVAGHEGTADWIAEELHTCLQEIVDEVDLWSKYVKDGLEYCLQNVESPEQ